ncbi:7658_t:CDS:2 [Paraglomus occultum]|uniref:7658_t:CDS:1 n=1 Tax=Paraglomus occultum TaxID=144539 RepID=A0A9N9G4S7_9GLOM|nr:7658_t:CDS:2 [Paraglomus occultum]
MSNPMQAALLVDSDTIQQSIAEWCCAGEYAAIFSILKSSCFWKLLLNHLKRDCNSVSLSSIDSIFDVKWLRHGRRNFCRCFAGCLLRRRRQFKIDRIVCDIEPDIMS